MFALQVEYSGWAAILSQRMNRNLWKGTRPFGRAARASYGEALDHWWKTYLSKRFQKDAKHKYGYKKRKPPYLEIKKKLAQGKYIRDKDGKRIQGREAVVIRDGEADNVRSGQTERRALSNRNIVTYPTYGDMQIRVPFYITIRYRGDKPRMDKELTTVTPDEEIDCSIVAEREFLRVLVNEGRRARKRKLRIPGS